MPEVFISYRQIHDAERQRVRLFAEQLRSAGLTVIFDQFFLDTQPRGPDDGWDKWSSDRALQTEFVVIIGTAAWFQCFEKNQPPGTGLGAACEADDLRHRIYEAGGIIEHIRVVLFDDADSKHVPGKLKRYHHFHAQRDFARIVNWLGGTAPLTAPPIDPSVLATQLGSFPRLDRFFGRAVELKLIHQALAPDTDTWGFAIEGAGGMGKTTLALQAAHQVPQGRFQQHLFVSAKSQDLGPDGLHPLGGFSLTGWLPMLDEIARLLDLPDIAKAPEDQRPRLLCEALSSRRVLLILDNLETFTRDEQHHLLAFLDRLPRSCKAILTTRLLYGHHRHCLMLNRIDKTAARLWLEDLAKASPVLAAAKGSSRHNLYDSTGGNPLMLRWVVSQLGHGSCRNITHALKLIVLAKRDDNPLRFIFGHLLPLLSPADIRVLATLSYPTEPIPTAAIAEISQLDLEATQTALNTLINHSLVVPDENDENHALVPTVAEFIRHVRPEVVQQSGEALAERAYVLIMENGGKNHDRFPALEAAWPGIAPALSLFLAGDNTRLQIVCDALQIFLPFQGRWDEWLALSEKAEARAVASSDFDKAGWRAFHVGAIHHLRTQADALLICADRATAHWDRAKAGARERAVAIGLRGHGSLLKKDYPAAITAYRESLDLRRSLAAESADVAIALNALAAAEHRSGDLAAAEGHYREALRVARTVGYSSGLATSTGNLAALALSRNDWPAAEILAHEALPLSEAIHRQELIAADNHRLAQALVRQGKTTEALPHARRALDIYTRLGSPHLAGAQAILAECERALAPS